MLIIGITGTIGAGKGTVVDYLTSRYGFKHYSVRKYLTELLRYQGIEPNRDHFTALANDMVRENSENKTYTLEAMSELILAVAFGIREPEPANPTLKNDDLV